VIPVVPAPEPSRFDEEVRQPGLSAYDRICAYVCVYIPPVTGQPSVDHMMPKSRAWNHVYEWSNYRLACALMNSRKGATTEVLDPFEVGEGWFELELVGFQVLPGAGLEREMCEKVEKTIRLLGLNDGDCRDLRASWAETYWDGEIAYTHLTRRAPFVARELRRQGRLNEGEL